MSLLVVDLGPDMVINYFFWGKMHLRYFRFMDWLFGLIFFFFSIVSLLVPL